MIDNFNDITDGIRRIDKEIENLTSKPHTNTSGDNASHECDEKVQDAIKTLLDIKDRYVLLCSLYSEL